MKKQFQQIAHRLIEPPILSARLLMIASLTLAS